MWHFLARFARVEVLLHIYSKKAENKMSFEIHMTTIATGSLSFGLKNPWVFWTGEFFRAWVFSKMLKKPGLMWTFWGQISVKHVTKYLHWLALKKECCPKITLDFLQGGRMRMHSVNQVWWQFTWHCCFVTSFFLLFSNQSCLWAQRVKNHNIWNIFCIQKPLDIHSM